MAKAILALGLALAACTLLPSGRAAALGAAVPWAEPDASLGRNPPLVIGENSHGRGRIGCARLLR
jgi:hypothetical protein